MPLNPRNLRIWFAATALLLLAVVAGFYGYGRYRMRAVLRAIPQKKLGINIQQSAQGFTYSQSSGGHTIFTIHAAKAEQTTSGRAELRDVNIVVYGQQSNRFDQIYGAEFDYDPKTGDVRATGEVHIDLQGNAQGPIQPDLTPPRELNNPIHLKTSGLVFNRNTGMAETKERIEFRVPQVSGSAVGATYDSKGNMLTLGSAIALHSTGPRPADLTARHGVITKYPARVVLDDAHLSQPGKKVDAQQLTVYLRDDNTIEHLLATGKVSAESKTKAVATAEAPRVEVYINGDNEVKSALFSGGVVVDSQGDQPIHGNAGRVTMDFAAGNQLQTVHARDQVKLVQYPAKGKPQTQTTTLTSDAVDFFTRDQKLTRAETSGPAQVTITPQQAANGAPPGSTIATAERFIANFSKQGKLSTVVGSPNAKVVQAVPGQPDRTTTSNVLTLTMSPQGNIGGIVQEGSFHYFEAAAKPGSTSREAWADRATYNPADETLALSGSPRITDLGMTTTAARMKINRRTGDAVAEGEVKTTYSELKPQPGGALLATSEPIHVTAGVMNARKSTEMAVYSGGARLWQGANIIEAPTIEFDRGHRSIVAQGKQGQPVTTVFVQQSPNGKEAGKQTPVNVTGAKLSYIDAQRKAVFDGGVLVRGADSTMNADQVEVFLHEQGQKQNSVASQLDKIVASGHVVIQQPNRRGTGNKLTYLAENGSFRLTGGPPSIFDAERGNVTGDSLTFYSHDDRVLVEGGSTTPSVTKAKVSK